MISYPSKERTRREIQTAVEDAKDLQGKPLFGGHRFTALSRIGTIIRAVANAITLFIDANLVRVQNAIHPHTSAEEDLHEHLFRKGSEWRDEVAAVHLVRIGSSTLPTENRPIPQGQKVSTSDETVEFRTKAPVYVDENTVADSEGHYTIEVLAEAIVPGISGNVPQNSITNIIDPPDGIDIVYNPDPDPVTTGQPRETITEVRNRLRNIEEVQGTLWTPPWYVEQAESNANVTRAVFKSAKALGIPGLVKVFVLGAGGVTLSGPELQAIADQFDTEENDPGGVARVVVENFVPVEINKLYTVRFPDADSLPNQADLDEIAANYFGALGEGEDFDDTAFRNAFLGLPKALDVVPTPPGDVAIGSGEVAIQGPSFSVVAEVYSA